MAKKTFITNILVVVSFILCPMSVLSVGATTQGEGTPSISEREGIIEKPAFYLKVQKGFLSVEIDNAPLLIYTQTKWDRGKGSPTILEEVRIFGEGDYEQSFGLNLLEGKRSVPSTSLKGRQGRGQKKK